MNNEPEEYVYEIDYPSTTAVYHQGSIYHSATSKNLFEDIRAGRVGDTITVILEEETTASKTASSNASKEFSTENTAPTLFGRKPTEDGEEIGPSDYESSTEFAGSGDTNQSNSLSGNITVTVMKILPNGNLVIRGHKSLSINQESENVTVNGIVRPIDISPGNTINSGQIARAEITYGGKGAIASSTEATWLAKFFNSGWWPF